MVGHLGSSYTMKAGKSPYDIKTWWCDVKPNKTNKSNHDTKMQDYMNLLNFKAQESLYGILNFNQQS